MGWTLWASVARSVGCHLHFYYLIAFLLRNEAKGRFCGDLHSSHTSEQCGGQPRPIRHMVYGTHAAAVLVGPTPTIPCLSRATRLSIFSKVVNRRASDPTAVVMMRQNGWNDVKYKALSHSLLYQPIGKYVMCDWNVQTATSQPLSSG